MASVMGAWDSRLRSLGIKKKRRHWRKRWSKGVRPQDPQAQARQVWEAIWPLDPWPKGLKVYWVQWMRGAMGLRGPAGPAFGNQFSTILAYFASVGLGRIRSVKP